jgi:putative alpha-1,2-mannosidase
MLKRADVIDPGDASEKSSRYLTIFYTGLYRALTFPRRIDEVDANGNMIHYSPYDPHGQTHPGPLVTDNGFWDTYRTVYPLLSLVYPDFLGIIVQGIINGFEFVCFK